MSNNFLWTEQRLIFFRTFFYDFDFPFENVCSLVYNEMTAQYLGNEVKFDPGAAGGGVYDFWANSQRGGGLPFWVFPIQ